MGVGKESKLRSKIIVSGGGRKKNWQLYLVHDTKE